MAWSFFSEFIETTSKRQNCSALCGFFARYQAAVRESLLCLCVVTDSAPLPCCPLLRYLTSTNTTVSSCSMIRSISPKRLEKFLSRTFSPRSHKKDSAVFSHCAPACRLLSADISQAIRPLIGCRFAAGKLSPHRFPEEVSVCLHSQRPNVAGEPQVRVFLH